MHRNLSLPLALLMALPTAACLDNGSGNDSQDVSTALEQTNGGFDTADEAPEFGAQADFTAAAIESDSAASDTLAADPATTAADTASAAAGFRALVVWGKLPADRDTTTSRDWSGSLKVSRGGLIVRRTIAFEDRTDKLLRARRLARHRQLPVGDPAVRRRPRADRARSAERDRDRQPDPDLHLGRRRDASTRSTWRSSRPARSSSTPATASRWSRSASTARPRRATAASCAAAGTRCRRTSAGSSAW